MKTINVKELIDQSPLRRFHARVFLCCIISLAFEGYDLVVYGATLPLLMKAWQMTPAFAGLVASFGFGAAVVGALVGGALGDRWGRKRTIITSVVVYSLGSLLCALAHAPFWFAFFRIFGGIGMGMTLQNEVGMVSEYFPTRMRQAAVAAVTTGMQWGGILSALVAIVLIERYGWASAYYFGALPILLVPVLVRALPEAPWILVLRKRWTALRAVLAEVRPDVELTPETRFTYPKSEEKSSIVAVFADGRLVSTLLFWTVYFLNIFTIYGTNTWIPKLMIDSGRSVHASLTIYLALFVGALIASPILGYVADRVGTRPVLVASSVCGFAVIALLAAPMSLPVAIVLVGLVGVCTMGAQNVTHAFIARYYPPAVKSTMMGWGLSVGRFGGLLGPIAGGLLLNFHAPAVASYLVFAAPCLLSALAIGFVQERYAFDGAGR